MKPNTQNWEKLRPEIIDGQLTFFDDDVLGDHPTIYYLSDLLSLKEQENLCEQHGNRKQFCPDCLGMLREGDYSYQLDKREQEVKKELCEEIEKRKPNHKYCDSNEHGKSCQKEIGADEALEDLKQFLTQPKT
ncbi:MAG: hypothetical protein PHW73_05915 [Atribacterota bacterium]|nr:hypothetical protein [Atribacterota bacterium]